MKEKRVTPTGDEVCAAINNVLDKAINAESRNAPKRMRLLLTEMNPNWKLPERRVAKYLKRILKSRRDPTADGIDVDDDDISTTASNTSSRSVKGFFRRIRSRQAKPPKGGGEADPQDILYLPRLVDNDDNTDGENMEPGPYQTSQSDAYTDQSERNEIGRENTLCCEGSNCVTM